MQSNPFRLCARLTLYRYDFVVLYEIFLCARHHNANFLNVHISTGHFTQKFCDISKSSHARQPLQYFSHDDLVREAEISSQSTLVRSLLLSLINTSAFMSSVSSLDLALLYLGSR
jgi:hypothetical protein